MPESTADPRLVALLWSERSGPTRGPRPSLTMDQIAAAAVRIADTDGLAAASMQRIAEALGVTKMALYRYVRGKGELLAIAVDAALAPPPDLDETGTEWRPRLERWAQLQRERWRRHPWLPAAVAGDRVLGPNEVGWIDRGLAALLATGLGAPERMAAVLLLWAPVRALPSATPVGTQPWTIGQARSTLLHLLEQRDEFPAVVAAMTAPTAEDAGWELGLRVVLDGLERAERGGRTSYRVRQTELFREEGRP